MGNTYPLVSIITRTCNNRNGALGRALLSVYRQTYRPIEIVLVEDGTRFVGDLLRELPAPEGISVRWLPIEKGGRCRAGNAGLGAATGRYLCFLDDDDEFLPDHLETLVGCLERHPELGGAYCLAQEVPTSVQSYTPFVFDEKARRIVHDREFSREALWVGNYFPIQAILFRRSLFETYGGFDPELENLEDWDLWVRYTVEYPFKRIGRVTSFYRVPSDEQSVSQRNSILDSYFYIAKKKQDQVAVRFSHRELPSIIRNIIAVYRIFRPLVMLSPAVIDWFTYKSLSFRAFIEGNASDGNEIRQSSVGELVALANQVLVESPILFGTLRLSQKLKQLGNK